MEEDSFMYDLTATIVHHGSGFVYFKSLSIYPLKVFKACVVVGVGRQATTRRMRTVVTIGSTLTIHT